MLNLEKERYYDKKSNIPIWVVVFDNKKEKVLLVRELAPRKEGLVGLPGGRPKNSAETEKEAGIRELREETGLFARDLISYPQNTYTDFIKRENRQKSYIGKAYIAVDVQGRLNRYTKETKAFWARIDKLDRYKKRLSPTVKAVVYASLNALELE